MHFTLANLLLKQQEDKSKQEHGEKLRGRNLKDIRLSLPTYNVIFKRLVIFLFNSNRKIDQAGAYAPVCYMFLYKGILFYKRTNFSTMKGR